MVIAERISRLGTETAFAVSAQAAAFSALGNRVYPFHLGDLNFKTPDNIIEAAHRAMRDGKTGYCPSCGIPELRDALATDVNSSRGTSYAMENVAIEPGGKPVISKFIMALMNPGDEVLYPNPGYPIYESQIEFYGGKAVPYGYVERAGNFQFDPDALEARITPHTRLLILNDPQNPTGAECRRTELERVADIVMRHDLYVLSDESYFDMRYDGDALSLVSVPGMAQRTVILYTFSKKYAMTGWRLGAAIGPAEIIDVFAKLNVNDESCTNQFVQWAAIEALTGDQSGAKRILNVLKERRDTAVALLNSIAGVHCCRPNATFYLFPNVTEMMRNLQLSDYESLTNEVLRQTGVSVCTRMHFGRTQSNERERYIRLAYSGIEVDDIRAGLTRLRTFIEGGAKA